MTRRLEVNTYELLIPWFSKKLEAPSLNLLYALLRPTSNVLSGRTITIIAINKYSNPVTIHVDLSPIDSSLLKYCIVSEARSLLKNNEKTLIMMLTSTC